MRNLFKILRTLFPGRKYYFLIILIAGSFLVSIFDLFGVAIILPIVQLATGAPYDSGYIGWFSDFIHLDSRNSLIGVISIILILSFLMKSILSLWIKWKSSGFIAEQQVATSVEILRSYSNESYIDHKKRSKAEILRNSNDAVNQAYSGFVNGFINLTSEVSTILLLMVMLVIMMPLEATLAGLYFSISAFIVQRLLKKKNTGLGRASLMATLGMTQTILNQVNGFRENRIHGVSKRNLWRFQDKKINAVNIQRRMNFYYELPKYILEIIFIFGIVLLMFLFTFREGNNNTSYLVVFTGACVRILPSFTRLVGGLGNIRVGFDSAKLIFNEIKKIENKKDLSLDLIQEFPKLGKFSNINKEIIPVELNIKNVYFKYQDEEEYVLNNIDINVPFGSSLALVGSSGSGKTTLVDIILGLLNPSKGSILVNGKDIHNDIEDWYSKIGYVPQDVFFTDVTLKEAIAYGLDEDEIDEYRINEVIRIAELTSVVDNLENGINTRIGENGLRLSGGQRQRVGIARALYRNPSVLILDEATSALDNKTEDKITKTINNLNGEIIVIIVAHRLSTIKNTDNIIFLKDGFIESSGDFNYVQKNNTDFAQLVKLGNLES